MEVVNDNPEAIQESLDRAHESGSEFFLGSGHNAEVVASTRQEGICYKTLYLERAQKLGVNVAREALIQNAVHNFLQNTKFANHVPKVEGFVRTSEVQAIKMEKIEGFSLRQYMDDPVSNVLPDNFDPAAFFNQLEELIDTINAAGYFHRDLVGNAGNVLCTSDGKPVLVDFGSAVKAINYDPEDHSYQIVPGGRHYTSTDKRALSDLKNKFARVGQDAA